MKKTVLRAAACLCAASVLLTACGAAETKETVDLTQLTLDEIIEGAKAEGELASVGMPDDWANWKGSWEAITDTYGVQHTDSDMSSAE